MPVEVYEGLGPPPESAAATGCKWYRVPREGRLDVVILSEVPVWYPGHWVKKRYRPCVRPGCRYCAEDIAWQWRYVVSVASLRSKVSGLIDVGQAVGLQIDAWIGLNERLRGMTIRFRQQREVRCWRMVVELLGEPPWIGWEDLPARKILPTLKKTWGVSAALLQPAAPSPASTTQESIPQVAPVPHPRFRVPDGASPHGSLPFPG